jgi:hypothetical protein
MFQPDGPGTNQACIRKTCGSNWSHWNHCGFCGARPTAPVARTKATNSASITRWAGQMRSMRRLRNSPVVTPWSRRARSVGLGQHIARQHQEEVGGQIAAPEGRMDREQRHRGALGDVIEHDEQRRDEPQEVQGAAAGQAVAGHRCGLGHAALLCPRASKGRARGGRGHALMAERRPESGALRVSARPPSRPLSWGIRPGTCPCGVSPDFAPSQAVGDTPQGHVPGWGRRCSTDSEQSSAKSMR